MINFRLNDIDEIQPAGRDGNLSMSWFWLTDGDLWLDLANSTLYEYTKEAQEHFEMLTSPYNNYPIVRFIEDFTELFAEISESIPDDLYQLTENLNNFLTDTQKWLDLDDSDEDEPNDFYFEEYDQLISWTYNRTLDSGHLIGGPDISFFRHKDKIRIAWETEHKLDNGIYLWAAKNGNIEISYNDFILGVKDYGKRFFGQMKKQVDLAVKKDWNDIQIDKKRLIKEHSDREKDFWEKLSLLESKSTTVTNWESVRESKSKMEQEI